MGRENMEDFTSFSVLLETWEAGSNYFAHLSVQEIKIIEVAKLLGWVRKSDISPTRTKLNPPQKVAEGSRLTYAHADKQKSREHKNSRLLKLSF
jgi:hypothetical protein